jgi:hypothetical protein
MMTSRRFSLAAEDSALLDGDGEPAEIWELLWPRATLGLAKLVGRRALIDVSPHELGHVVR